MFGILAQAADLGDPLPFAQALFSAVVHGNWWTAAAALLVVVVAVLRKFGKMAEDSSWAPAPLKAVLGFIFGTTPGGWLLNLATAIAAGLGAALLAGEPPTWALVKPILVTSLSGAAIWELVKDTVDWWQARKLAPVPAPSPTP